MKLQFAVILFGAALIIGTSPARAQDQQPDSVAVADSAQHVVINNYYYGWGYPGPWWYYSPGYYYPSPFFAFSLGFGFPFHSFHGGFGHHRFYRGGAFIGRPYGPHGGFRGRGGVRRFGGRR